MKLDTRLITRLGIDDEFVPHGSRAEVLADIQVDKEGIAKACRTAAKELGKPLTAPRDESSIV